MVDNIEILRQGGFMVALMLLSFLPEIFCLFNNYERKGIICFLGLVSKVAIVYSFSLTMVIK